MLLLCLTGLSNILPAQQRNGNPENGGIIISGKSGISMFVTEVFRDFSGAISEFGSTPGPYAGLEVSRLFTPSLEAGAGVSTAFLNGRTNIPNFSAIGYQTPMEQPLNGPVAYTNRLIGPELFARYRFRVNNSSRHPLGIILKTGAGLLFNESEIYYQERTGDEIIFGKGLGPQKSTLLVTGVYILGSGLSYSLSEQINLNLATNFNFVGYDFLDVVHNYDSEGNRREVVGLYTDITLGISIRLERGDKSSATGRSRQSSGSGHLPFSPR